MDDTGFKTLALFPAKFRKSLWIERGDYVLVEESDKERAL
jgi:probable RNA-binding protein EIF1AD